MGILSVNWLIDWLIDNLELNVVSAVFQPYTTAVLSAKKYIHSNGRTETRHVPLHRVPWSREGACGGGGGC